MNLEGKIITIVGLARSGQAAARLAYELGAIVRLTDSGGKQKIDASFLKWASDCSISMEFEQHTQAMIDGSDCVVISPGVCLASQPVEWACEKNIPVVGELEFSAQFCPCPIIAVTGSNGKTTVTTLIGRVLKEAGREVFVGGNIGRPLSEDVLDLTAKHIAVLEVSSFQLETIKRFRPHVAVFLNLSQNHLDRHADMEEYFSQKARIFENQTKDDFAILNAKDEKVFSLRNKLAAQVGLFNTDEQRRETGYDNPNFLAVDRAVSVVGIHSEFCQKIFKEFQGIDHRLELVRDIQGIRFINDSKSTTTEASRWALTQIHNPVVWICGGRDKNLDFSVLRELAGQKVKRIVAIGEAADKIKKSFLDIVDVECGLDFDQAIKKAFSLAIKGDVVLLSPMCASFDMFKNFEHRGEEFKRIVNAL